MGFFLILFFLQLELFSAINGVEYLTGSIAALPQP
jgi:hypothetical protein